LSKPEFDVDLAQLQALLDRMYPGHLGIKLLEVGPARVVAELEARPELCTTGDMLHGGVYMGFADTLGAVGTFLNMQPGQRTTTTDSSTKFMAAARIHSRVRGESVPLHRGRTTMVWHTEIRNAEGKLCAVVTQTQLIMD
jgi:uncharacterized protein (TIGR00369 family)